MIHLILDYDIDIFTGRETFLAHIEPQRTAPCAHNCSESIFETQLPYALFALERARRHFRRVGMVDLGTETPKSKAYLAVERQARHRIRKDMPG